MSQEQKPVAVVEEVAKVQGEQTPVEQPAAPEQKTPVEKEATKEEPTAEQPKSAPVESETAEPSSEKNPEVSASEVEEKAAGDEVKVVEPTNDETPENGTNGKDHPETAENGKSEEAAEPVKQAEVETNGVCKRKAENGSEAVDAGDKTESSPKKVKVVNEGEQAPTEETAA